MPGITFDRLKNNIAEDEVAGPLVMVTFRCPVTEKMYHSIATMHDARVAEAAVGLLDRARGGLEASLHKVFEPMPEQAHDKISGEPLPAHGGTKFDRAAHERAVVEAFEAVAPQFAWDNERKAFIDAEEANNPYCAFDRQLIEHPLMEGWDRIVAARMLAAIAAADGTVTEAERHFFSSVLNRETGTLMELIEAGAPSRLELEETRPGSRATLLMLAHALALTDEKFDEREAQLLEKFAAGLGVALERVEQVRHWAAEKVIENILLGCYADGKLDAAEQERIGKLAVNIGVNEALVAKVDVRVRKRLG